MTAPTPSARLAELVHALGLQPAPAPQPLPPITADDIHLIAWLAITPVEAST